MTENHIILIGMLLSESNDRKTMKYVLKDIKETVKLFIEMQKEFGERWNYKEIRRRLREHILIADSGYFSTENLHYLFKNKINALVMSKKLSEVHNLGNERGGEDDSFEGHIRPFALSWGDFLQGEAYGALSLCVSQTRACPRPRGAQDPG